MKAEDVVISSHPRVFHSSPPFEDEERRCWLFGFTLSISSATLTRQ
jgi:hypothetical protein